MIEETQKTIEQAISNCQDTINVHTNEAKRSLRIVILSLIFLGTIFFVETGLKSYNQKRLDNSLEQAQLISKELSSNMSYLKLEADYPTGLSFIVNSYRANDSLYQIK